MVTNREYWNEHLDELLDVCVTRVGVCVGLEISEWRKRQPTTCGDLTCETCRREWLDAPHKESIEDIKLDARNSAYRYWNCTNIGCDECPHINKPSDVYKVCDCGVAMHLDIIARCEVALGNE